MLNAYLYSLQLDINIHTKKNTVYTSFWTILSTSMPSWGQNIKISTCAVLRCWCLAIHIQFNLTYSKLIHLPLHIQKTLSAQFASLQLAKSETVHAIAIANLSLSQPLGVFLVRDRYICSTSIPISCVIMFASLFGAMRHIYRHLDLSAHYSRQAWTYIELSLYLSLSISISFTVHHIIIVHQMLTLILETIERDRTNLLTNPGVYSLQTS